MVYTETRITFHFGPNSIDPATNAGPYGMTLALKNSIVGVTSVRLEAVNLVFSAAQQGAYLQFAPTSRLLRPVNQGDVFTPSAFPVPQITDSTNTIFQIMYRGREMPTMLFIEGDYPAVLDAIQMKVLGHGPTTPTLVSGHVILRVMCE